MKKKTKKRAMFALAGAAIFVFGFLLGAVWMSNRFIGSFSISTADREEPVEFSSGESFWAYQYFGGMNQSEDRMKPLPPGRGVLRIKMTHDGRSAVGVSCKVFLNGKFKAPAQETDGNGDLTVGLPEGDWQVNAIQCSSWKNKPEGEYMLVLPGLRRLGRSQEELFSEWRTAGKKVQVTSKAPETPQISLLMNRRVDVVWPGKMGPKQDATLTRTKIKWKSYPQATDYVVKIHRVTREERSTIYMPILDKRIAGETELDLSSLAHTRDATSKEEYAVSVEAFAKDGEFLGESQSFDGTFTLTDGNVLMEDRKGILNEAGENKIAFIYRERKKLETAETLIKEKMFDQAVDVLSRVTESDLQGQKALMTGYLYASKGDCKNAKLAFEEAQKKGEDCIPDEYQGNCK